MVLRPACRRTRRQLWDYSQQTVREDALEEMERHLRQCAGCRSEAAAYRHAIACLTATRQQPQPVVPDTWLAVRERLHRPVVAPRRDRRIGTLLALGATLCAVLIGDRMSERHRPTALAGAGGGDHAQPSPSPGGRDAHVDSAGLVALPQLPRRASVPRGLQPEARRALRGTPAPHFPAVVEDDLAYLNRSPGAATWSPVRPDELEAIKARIDRTVRAGDAFIEVPFPRLAANDRQLIAAAAVAYAHEKATVDPRLAKQVRLSVRGISLSELCRSLSERTSIRLSADRSVADQKVTLFVTDQPLREIMAQLSRLFGFTWSRSRRPTAEADEYQYELTQGLRAQLLEEELRNRELNEALLALDLELRRPLPEGPAVPPADLSRVSLQERTRLERLAEQRRWAGANRLYQRLSPAQVAALRAGQTVEFSTEAEQAELRIPDELRHSLLQAHGSFRHYTADGEFVDDDTGMTLAEVPSAGVSVAFSLEQREPGRLSLRIEPDFTLVRDGVRIPIGGRGSSEIALGASPAVRPDNAARNRALRQDPQFRRRVSVEPKPHCRFLLKDNAPSPEGAARTAEARRVRASLPPLPHIDSGDVWEALHRETGMPIVADYYSRLYPPARLTCKDEPLFDALCRISDELQVHWKKDGDFLVARSATYLWDNLQEVPNRLLDRWSDRRRQRGETSFEDLLEMASLTDVQLSSRAGGQVVTHCRDLPEWRLLARAGYSARGMGAGFPWLLRALAGMPAAVRAQVLHERGLAVSDLTPQPQGEVIRALQQWNYQPLELSRARIHLDFVPAGRYVWTPPHERFSTEAYYALPVVSAKSPEQALLLAGPIDPRAEPSEVHRTEGVLALFVHDYQGRTSSQGRPE